MKNITTYSTATDIASYFLSKESMSNKKLNKLLYYAYSWTLTLLNDAEEGISRRLFDDKFEAWVHGPVCPNIYHQYKVYGWDNIPKYVDCKHKLPEQIVDVLEGVWKEYSKYSADQLESISHQESPWREQRVGLNPFDPCNAELDDNSIYNFYIKMTES